MYMDYAKLDRDNEAFFVKQMKDGMKGGAAEKIFFQSGLSAHEAVIDDELMPSRDEESNLTYSVEQGLKAACHAREDVAAILRIQLPALRLLHQLKALLWACLAALVYIAYRVS